MNKLHPLKINSRKLSWEDNQPHSLDYDDRFFQANVIDETQEVFITANNLKDRWQNLEKDNFKIAELGFGFGLNFLITAKFWHEQNLINKKWLDYVSIDCFSLNIEDFKKIVKNYQLLKEYGDELVLNFPIECNGFTRIDFPKFKIRLTLIINNVDDALVSLVGNDNNKFDAWYFDGFDPSKNISMWSPNVFSNINLLSKENTTFGTYTAAGFVRRGLEENNFNVSKVKGFGNKRHRLQGVFSKKDKTTQLELTPKKVAIIGSGIAGTCLAYKLANQDISVDIFDKKKDLNLNPWAAMYPKFSLGLDPRSDLLVQGYLYAHRFYTKVLSGYKNTGILFLNNGEDRDSWIKRILKLDRDDLFVKLTADEINTQNKVSQDYDGIKINIGGCISIDEFNKALMQHENINFISEQNFLSYKLQDGIKLEFDNGKTFNGYTHLVLCSGGSLQSLIPKIGLKHGAIAGFDNKLLKNIQYPINNNGYVLPECNGINWAGSIYSNDEMNTGDSINYQNIIEKNNHLLIDEDISHIKSRWIGTRASLPDYLPVTGAIEKEKVYALGGLGSRGLSLAPLLAETIMNEICNIPSPISQEVKEAISPLRFND